MYRMSRTYIIQAIKQDTRKTFRKITSDKIKKCEPENSNNYCCIYCNIKNSLSRLTAGNFGTVKKILK
jgi:hypothetical protein